MIVGNTYLEKGKPVTVLAQWRTGEALGIGSFAHFDGPMYPTIVHIFSGREKGSGPRNVLIQRQNRELVVRPFRGLRKVPG